jgi:hypothetical protein
VPEETSPLVATLIGGAIGFASAVFAEPLRRWLFSPSLTPEFGEGADFRAQSPERAYGRVEAESNAVVESSHVAEYPRVRVTNTARTSAKGCRAYLASVDRQDRAGQFCPVLSKAFRSLGRVETVPNSSRWISPKE